jgi:hypothetical protein
VAEWWLLWAWRIIAVLGLGAVLVWMGKTIKAMKVTVDTQKDTISALRSVLDAADLPKMAERFRAYKEITDREKEADVSKLVREFEEERKTLARGSQAFADFTETHIRALTESLMDFSLSALPYIPKDERREFIDQRIDVPGGVGPILKNALYHHAAQAPDFSQLSGLSRLAGFGTVYLRPVSEGLSETPLPARTISEPPPPGASSR